MSHLKRFFLIVCVVALWGSFIWQMTNVQNASSNTPLINNIRRALNDCVVRGRLTNEFDGNAQFINMNSRIVCDLGAAGTKPNAYPPRLRR